ncbi:MAG TPA: DUF2225 domain-containing protein [Bacillota bacterium]|nr:DUF2225 domain-containing protein [Bacillota bacterium]HPT86309.1 DUF2225 domain-containing protein [Bacillota bacterium]
MAPKTIYNTTVVCPACEREFTATKVRLNAYRVLSQDSDFAAIYEGVNPILYQVFVCEHCGYAAFQDRFDQLNPKERKIINTQVGAYWKHKSYSGERTLDSALEAYKLALYCLQLRKAKSSEIAKTCLRIAWIYRWKGDQREKDFLKFALELYTEAYQSEDLPFDKMDAPHCIYLIAELNRKTGNLEEATKWFGRLFSSPEARQDKFLWDLAHEQYQLVKDSKEGNASPRDES